MPRDLTDAPAALPGAATRLAAAALAAALTVSGPALGLDDEEGARGADAHRPSALAADRGPETSAEPVELPPLFRELCPQRAAQLDRLAAQRPERFQRIARHIVHLMRELDALKRGEPKEYEARVAMLKLEEKIEMLALNRRAAKTDAERAQIDKDLGAALGELFDRREARQRERLVRMEEDLKALKARLDSRKALRSKIIERRLNDLKGDEDLEF